MKEFLKQKLIENKPKIYSLLVQYYADKVEELGCSLFRNWLSEELAVEENKINRASLYSAIRRRQLKNKAIWKTMVTPLDLVNKKDKTTQNHHFFSDPDTLPVLNSRITEL